MPLVFGLEHEFGVTRFHEGARLEIEPVLRSIFGISWSYSQQFLRNGARFYRDVGDHPEYATPECDSVFDLLAHDKAGERVLEAAAIEAERRLHENGEPGTVFVFKNNTDSAGRTYGSHENYQVPRAQDLDELADLLLPFLVTRQLLVGAGNIQKTPNGPVYTFSQRAPFMYEGLGAATMSQRAIITTRDEPHADAERFRRLHVIVGDSNMNEVTTFLKVATTNLVLDMIADGVPLADLRVIDPAADVRRINLDISGRAPVYLQDGRRLTAVGLQREYLRRARRYAVEKGILHNPSVGPALELWRRTLRAVHTGDYRSIARDIDWATKLAVISSYQAKSGLPLDHPKVAHLNLGYHDIDRGRGLYYQLERRGSVNRALTDLRIFEAKSKAPLTRAALRGDFVKRAAEQGLDYMVDWSAVGIKAAKVAEDPTASSNSGRASSGTGKRDIWVQLPDALKSADERVDRLTRQGPAQAASLTR